MGKQIETREVQFLDEFLCILEEIQSQEDLIFRGQRKNWPLLPKIARDDLGLRTGGDILELEFKLIDEFRRIGRSYVDLTRIDDDWDWLAMGQHHGLATRLLDWTTNAFAGIWFAVEKPPLDKKPGFVYIYKPTPSDFLDTSKISDPFRVTNTQIVRPPHSNPRITAQSAIFTIHPYYDERGRFVAFEEDSKITGELIAVRIPADSFWIIRYDLDRCGVNRHSLFPDLDGISQYLNWLYTEYIDEKNKSRMSVKRTKEATG